MANLRRTSRVHTAGVDPTLWHDFPVGTRVRVVEGFLGTVTAVEDGPHPGSEHYIVELDDGMGGGEWGPGELIRADGQPITAARTPQQDFANGVAEMAGLASRYDEDGNLVSEAGEQHVASEDYPELAEILTERPPLAHAERVASLQRQAQRDPEDPEAGERAVRDLIEEGEITHAGLAIKAVDTGRVLLTQRTPYSEDPEGVYGKWEFPGGSLEDGEDPIEGAIREFTEETGLTLPEDAYIDGGYCNGTYLAVVILVPGEAWTSNAGLLMYETEGIGWFEPDQVDGSDIGREEMDKTDWDLVREAVLEDEKISAQAGIFDRWVERVHNDLPPEVTKREMYHEWSYDWCRFRRDSRCYYPRVLNEEATKQAGYPVWVPEDRGYCERVKWEDQKTCPIAEPGPKSGHPKAQIEATVPWEQGGQRGGHPVPRGASLLPVMISEAAIKVAEGENEPEPEDPESGSPGVGRAQPHRDPQKSSDWLDQQFKEKQQRSRAGEPVKVLPDAINELLQTHRDNPYRASLIREATADFAFHVTAGWRDIQAKAKRIRTAGGVRVISSSPQYLVTEVKGDTSVYQATLMWEPGSRRVAMWECGCAWAAYSWGRSGRWKKYEGRMCSHALASQYEAQSQEYGGGSISEQPSEPTWRRNSPPEFYDKPPIGQWLKASVLTSTAGPRPCTDPEADTDLQISPVGSMAHALLSEGEHTPQQVHAALIEDGLDAPTAERVITEALRKEAFRAMVRGREVTVVALTPDGLRIDTGEVVRGHEVVYPTYHPNLGLRLHGSRADTGSGVVPPFGTRR